VPQASHSANFLYELSMTTQPNPPAAFEFLLQVERFYAGLLLAADSGADSEPSLGGKLLYAGELDARARALLVAANIAGAASLAASTDATAGKQAIRDGVVDFLVTSLDEALRILKNEIRTRQTVAVCVALAQQASETDFAHQMLERGVLPNLLGQNIAGGPAGASFLRQGARRVEPISPDANQVLLGWSVTSAPALWLPKLDALALDCLCQDCLNPDPSPTTGAARRWLRLAPRFLGRMAQGLRLLRCGESSAANFLKGVREQVERAEIGVPVNLRLSRKGQSEQYCFAPPSAQTR
jgi:urocanate hydratase